MAEIKTCEQYVLARVAELEETVLQQQERINNYEKVFNILKANYILADFEEADGVPHRRLTFRSFNEDESVYDVIVEALNIDEEQR